jgi:hypothetical protein
MAKFTLDVATDFASICAFDPAALPKDFDTLIGLDPLNTIETLIEEGLFWIEETGGTGNYVCHVYIDEAYPFTDAIWEKVFDQSDFFPFTCPSGKLWICGLEHAARNPRRGRSFEEPPSTPLHSKAISIGSGNHLLRVTQIANEDIRPTEPDKPPYFSWKHMAAFVLAILGIVGTLVAGLMIVFSFIEFFFGRSPVDPACACRRVFPGELNPLFLVAVSALPLWLGGHLKKIARQSEKRQSAKLKQIDRLRRKSADYIFEIRTNVALPSAPAS